MNNKLLLILGIFLIAGVVAISGCTSSGTSTDKQKINVTNVKVTNAGYGSYSVTADIVPNKDISYLEMATITYDSSGAVIDKSPLVWNINNVKSGEKLKAKGDIYLYQKGKPAKVQVMIFDSVFSGGDDSGALFKQNVTM
jgi:hypothetical protein